MAVPLVIFEDNAQLRSALEMLLNQSGKYQVLAGQAHCDNWRALVEQHAPQLIIMDIDMPGLGGLQGLREIKADYPDIKVVMYTVFDDDDRIVEAISQGANGYILKHSGLDGLLSALDEVMAGGAMMSPAVAEKVFSRFREQLKPLQDYSLSLREQEILQLLARGFTYKRIAVQAHISPETVKRHLRNIYTKLQVNCGTEAVVKAMRHQLITIE